jgi:hypothetical protein
MDIDKDIDTMQEIIEGRCPTCTQQASADRVHHDKTCAIRIQYRADLAEMMMDHELHKRTEREAIIKAKMSFGTSYDQACIDAGEDFEDW